MNDVTILLVDDHEIVRAGFKNLLLSSGRFNVLEAGSAEEGYELFLQERPDIVVMDLSMPGMGGLEAVRRIMAQQPDAKIIVLSMYDDYGYIKETRSLGALGYVTKRSATTELLKAIQVVLKGRHYLSGDLDYTENKTTRPAAIDDLSKREFEVFTLLTQGSSVVEVAENLKLSPKTVSCHRDNIMKKLQTRNMVDLTHYAIRHGIIKA